MSTGVGVHMQVQIQTVWNMKKEILYGLPVIGIPAGGSRVVNKTSGTFPFLREAEKKKTLKYLQYQFLYHLFHHHSLHTKEIYILNFLLTRWIRVCLWSYMNLNKESFSSVLKCLKEKRRKRKKEEEWNYRFHCLIHESSSHQWPQSTNSFHLTCIPHTLWSWLGKVVKSLNKGHGTLYREV